MPLSLQRRAVAIAEGGSPSPTGARFESSIEEPLYGQQSLKHCRCAEVRPYAYASLSRDAARRRARAAHAHCPGRLAVDAVDQPGATARST